MKNTGCLKGWACPRCGYDKEFEVEIAGTAILDDEGYGAIRNASMHDSCCVCCLKCNYEGVVTDFCITTPLPAPAQAGES